MVEHNGSVSVFRGKDLRTDSTVALKIPDPEMENDPVFFERFQREEEIGRSLDHPGILRVIADDQHSQMYIVTEWFNGAPLRQIMGGQRLTRERSARIAANIANALPTFTIAEFCTVIETRKHPRRRQRSNQTD